MSRVDPESGRAAPGRTAQHKGPGHHFPFLAGDSGHILAAPNARPKTAVPPRRESELGKGSGGTPDRCRVGGQPGVRDLHNGLLESTTTLPHLG